MKTLNEINKLKRNHNRNKKKDLPTLFFFTDRNEFSNIFSTISKLPKNTAIIIREYDLDYKNRLIFSKKIVTIAKQNSLVTFVAKDLGLALESGANGVHFSDREISWKKYLLHKKSNPKFLLSCSCHSEKYIQKALNVNVNFIFLSPIFKTTSHPNTKPLGIKHLRKLVNNNKPIYALGGISKKNIKIINSTKTQGIGVISLIKDIIN